MKASDKRNDSISVNAGAVQEKRSDFERHISRQNGRQQHKEENHLVQGVTANTAATT